MKTSVLKELTELQEMSLADLRVRWRERFQTQPPPYQRKQFIRRLAYRVQELACGGLSQEARDRMATLATDELAKRKHRRAGKRRKAQMVPGTRLVREWNGARHEVFATEDGFEYAGQRFRSLTAVAKIITGQHCSGPAFFGIRGIRGIQKTRKEG